MVTSAPGREVTSLTSPPRAPWARGANSSTLRNRPGELTPSRVHCAAASVCTGNLALSRSRCMRSSPLTAKTSARVCGARGPSSRSPSSVSNSMYSKNSAYVVFVATPEMPEIDTWPPLSPFRKEKSANTGWPS